MAVKQISKIALIIFFVLVSTSNAFEASISITPISMDFFGTITGAETGDIITVVDPDQVVCGKFVLSKKSRYGFLHVYGDDPTTPVDEGAEVSDRLTFLLNGKLITTDGIIWSGDKHRRNLNLSIK